MTDIKTVGAGDTKTIAGGNPNDNRQIVTCDQVTITGDGSIERPLVAIGGGSVGPGTVGALAKFTAANAIGDSIVSDDGTTVTIAGKLGINGAPPGGSQQAWITGTGPTTTTMLYCLSDDTDHVGSGGNNEAIGFVADMRSTFDTTAADAACRGVEIDITSTKSAGANNLVNTGIAVSVQGGTQNFSFLGIRGVLRNDDPALFGEVTCVNLTTSAVVALTGAAGSFISFSGAGGAITTTGAIQGASLHSTANTRIDGELIMTADTDQYWYASRANTSGNQAINFDSAGTGPVRINSNTGGLANSGTGGLEVYAGNNSVTLYGSITSSGVKTTGGAKWRSGTGDPEGVVTGSVGDLFSRTDGGAVTSFYVKESGAGNTGWVAK